MLLRRLFLAIALILTSSAVVPFGNGGAEARQVFDPSSRTWREIGRTSRAGKSKIKRKMVRYQTKEKPGTIIINTSERRLYHVQGNGKAMRYGVGVGRPGFQWSGTNRVSRKAEWPGWTPPAAMRKRQPGLPAYMPGGINNPLGARALYIFRVVNSGLRARPDRLPKARLSGLPFHENSSRKKYRYCAYHQN